MSRRRFRTREPELEDLGRVSQALEMAGLPCVLIGGAVVPLHLGAVGRAGARPTEDIDAVVRVRTTAEWHACEEKLRAARFAHDLREGAPICRFVFEDLTVDILPVAAEVLGFRASHLEAAVANAVSYEVAGHTIAIPTPADLFATKISAFFDRGVTDPHASEDLEDLIALLDDCAPLTDSLRVASADEREAAKRFLDWLAAHPERDDLIEGNVLDPGAADARAARLRRRVEELRARLQR